MLRIHLSATTFLYAAGVALTLFPVRDHVTLSNPVGGIVAVVLGVAALAYLAVRPQRPFPAAVAAIVATPVVMAFHVLTTAVFSCLIAAMFLAIYLRAFHPPRVAWTLVVILTAACQVALAVAPAPKAVTTYLIIPVAIVGVAESFGVVSRGLVTAACTDPLTGLLNRAGWEIATAELLARSRGTVVSVAALDLDGFKRINDTRGHAAGDEHLVARSRTWSALAPRGAVLARLGGDEFAVCIVAADVHAAQRFAQAVRDRTPDVSVGLASAPVAGADVAALMAAADDALYAEKRK